MSEFQLELQRFGGGGRGKDAGKMILGIVGFALGFANPAWFGLKAGQAFMAGLYGMSLATTAWSLVGQKQQPDNSMSSQFDVLQNTVSSEAVIPVIYGERRWAGNQSWHKTNTDRKELVKDIIIGEGEIDGIYGLTANDFPIKASGSNAFTIFSVYNDLHQDATIEISQTNSPTGDDKLLKLTANGRVIDVVLAHSVDAETVVNEYSIYINKLIAYLGNIGDGWKIIKPVFATEEPENIHIIPATNCYQNAVPVQITPLENCSYVFSNGSPAQDPPDNYETVGGYKNCAWTRVTLAESDKLGGGNPNITYTVRGLKVYDTRTQIKEWSDNPAMCIRDFMLSKRYGLGRYITENMLDEDSFKEAADYCDTIIEYYDNEGNIHYEKRYTLNIIIDQQQSAIEQLGMMLACFSGFITMTDNCIALKIEKESDAVYSFNDDIIIKDSVSFTQFPIDETPNQYRVGYVEPIQSWSSIKILSEDYPDQQQRGKIISKEVTLEGVTRQTQARRLVRLYKALNKVCSIVISFSVATHAMHLEPGDVIEVTWNNVFTNAPFRVLEIHEGNGVYQLRCRQYNASIYNDDLDAQIQIIDYTHKKTAYNSVPAKITNVDAYTNIDDEILIEHDESKDPFFASYRYYIEEIDTND